MKLCLTETFIYMSVNYFIVLLTDIYINVSVKHNFIHLIIYTKRNLFKWKLKQVLHLPD